MDAAPVLVVAATQLELAPLRAALDDPRALAGPWDVIEAGRLGRLRVALTVTGIGKVNAAAGLLAAAATVAPIAVVQVGVGGAYPGGPLRPGMVAAASEELQLDLGLRGAGGAFAGLEALGFALTPARGLRPARGNDVPTHPGLQSALAELGLPLLRFATLDAVTADAELAASLQRRYAVAVESMEGAAAAQVADRLGLPFAEVRGASNWVGERDKQRWDLRGAIDGSCRALLELLLRWHEHPATRALARSGVPDDA
jgi:futalosine hydrolase